MCYVSQRAQICFWQGWRAAPTGEPCFSSPSDKRLKGSLIRPKRQGQTRRVLPFQHPLLTDWMECKWPLPHLRLSDGVAAILGASCPFVQKNVRFLVMRPNHERLLVGRGLPGEPFSEEARLETPTTKGGALCQGTPEASEVCRQRRRRDIFVAHVTPPSKAPSGATSLAYVAPDGACGIGWEGVLQGGRAYGAEGRNQLLTASGWRFLGSLALPTSPFRCIVPSCCE